MQGHRVNLSVRFRTVCVLVVISGFRHYAIDLNMVYVCASPREPYALGAPVYKYIFIRIGLAYGHMQNHISFVVAVIMALTMERSTRRLSTLGMTGRCYSNCLSLTGCEISCPYVTYFIRLTVWVQATAHKRTYAVLPNGFFKPDRHITFWSNSSPKGRSISKKSWKLFLKMIWRLSLRLTPC